MHRDKKIGFALGILLLGIVAAFFFRNEPDPFADLPPLDDPQALDDQIAENPISPYAPPALAGTPASAPLAKDPWEIPENYRPNYGPSAESAGLPIFPGAPAPINLVEPIPEPPSSANRMIEVGSPFSEFFAPRPKSVPETPLPGNEAWTAVPEKPAPPAQKPAANLAETAPPGLDTKASQTALYKIVPGDTLSVLAEKHLGSSRRYMEIYEANRDRLRNPDDIKIGMQIRIPPRVRFTEEKPLPKPSAAPVRENQTIILPPPRQTNRFMPFSRSPLGPVHQ
jgi:hypothetical protein